MNLQNEKILPLENGDRLTRDEFERRYEAMPHLRKAELIEGVVYVPAALRFQSHGQPHGLIMTWIGTYRAYTPGVEFADAPTVRLDLDNEPQPDAVLLVEGGQAQLSDDDYIEGAPELIVEVAASSASYDLHDKKRVYRRNGVQEYVVWRVLQNQVDWFVLENGDYVNLAIAQDGILRSRQFPGLWLSASALLQRDLATVLSVLQTGLNSTEHQNFVQQLSERRA